MNHAEYQKNLKTKSFAELNGIIKDCQESLKANPDNPKNGHYQDEISYARMELNSRKGKDDSIWVIQAQTIETTESGKIYRQVPTFILRSDIQGIISEIQAEKIAESIINPTKKLEVIITATHM
jgi:hypothetical protein